MARLAFGVWMGRVPAMIEHHVPRGDVQVEHVRRSARQLAASDKGLPPALPARIPSLGASDWVVTKRKICLASGRAPPAGVSCSVLEPCRPHDTWKLQS